jgi:energy-coupling factor transport system permease protein
VSGALGWPMLLAGISLSFAGLAFGGRRVGRSRYRPDPWKAPEWIVAGSGLIAAAVLFAVGGRYAAALNPSTDPMTWPSLPLGPALGIAIALLPAVAAPRPPVAVDDDEELPAGIPLRAVTA